MPFRLITALRLQVEPPPGVHAQGIIANREGCNLFKSGVRRRPSKTRIVDVKVGDEVLVYEAVFRLTEAVPITPANDSNHVVVGSGI
jgi:hypothetical protein